jgi:hypothetical protein
LVQLTIGLSAIVCPLVVSKNLACLVGNSECSCGEWNTAVVVEKMADYPLVTKTSPLKATHDDRITTVWVGDLLQNKSTHIQT